MANTSLNKAKDAKLDEFYTRREDIEAELSHYREHFKDKVVYCNCDDPTWSEFWRFFVRVFKDWGLKKLMATHYEPDEKNYAYKLEITEDTNGDGRIDWNDEPTITQIQCNGDFRSQICIDMLKEADIVVTNPPFSLFREYVAQLMEYGKKFLIIGPLNALKYKEIFPLVKDGKMWTGYKNLGGGMNMVFPPHLFDATKVKKYSVDEEGRYIVNIMGVIWFTNLDIQKRHDILDLRGNYYKPALYPHYYNFDAIDVGKVEDIPCDYSGMMGVPITFIQNYNPDQFEIIGCSDVADSIPNVDILGQDWINGYRAQGGTGHYTANMKSLGLTVPKYKIVFSRYIIRNKSPEPRRYPDDN